MPKQGCSHGSLLAEHRRCNSIRGTTQQEQPAGLTPHLLLRFDTTACRAWQA